MNIDKSFLDQCELIIGPAISLAYGDERQRVLTLSPHAVPMEQGVCLIRNPAGETQLYGVSADRTLGIPQCLVEYTIERAEQDGHPGWRLVAYGLGLHIAREGREWVAHLGHQPLARFTTPHRGGKATVGVSEFLGPLATQLSQRNINSVTTLIERYI